MTKKELSDRLKMTEILSLDYYQHRELIDWFEVAVRPNRRWLKANLNIGISQHTEPRPIQFLQRILPYFGYRLELCSILYGSRTGKPIIKIYEKIKLPIELENV